MGKRPSIVILTLFLVKTNLAAPSTEARFDYEAKSGETQDQEPTFATYMTKLITKIKTVVMGKTEGIGLWNMSKFSEELESLQGSISSYFDDLITKVKSEVKGKSYF